MNTKEAIQQFSEERTKYVNLTTIVIGILEGLLNDRGVEYLSITGRAKEIDSFAEKCERKDYDNPISDITDLSGVRIITYIEDDVDKACELVKSIFNVHPGQSIDKSSELDVDRFGYRSFHYVCDLGDQRAELPEFSHYKGLKFEIQIRTVLQHAWAEIEHDRNYKYSGMLPSQLKRRFHLVAGLLELADREFNSIDRSLREYATEVSDKTDKGELDIEINATSINEYLSHRFAGMDVVVLDYKKDLDKVLRELSSMGVDNLSELDALISDELIKYIVKHKVSSTNIGILRMAMIFNNMEDYFKSAWNKNWMGLSQELYDLIVDKYGADKVDKTIKKYKLDTRTIKMAQ